ncbi:MAG TPA: helix-turn-helix transcriptional regulator [Thermoanaerobaculia bacterium]|nr:helix-turn-helix transcriptional regulator [Thermoanaerobaculia bacterium]
MLVVLRAALRWKQKDLARESGIGNSSISDYERRKKAPGRKNLGKLLEAMAYRPAVLDYLRRFLHELRTTYRVVEGESPYSVGSERTKLAAPAGAADFRARVDQVSTEVGRATEQFVRLALEIQMAHGPRPRPAAKKDSP